MYIWIPGKRDCKAKICWKSVISKTALLMATCNWALKSQYLSPLLQLVNLKFKELTRELAKCCLWLPPRHLKYPRKFRRNGHSEFSSCLIWYYTAPWHPCYEWEQKFIRTWKNRDECTELICTIPEAGHSTGEYKNLSWHLSFTRLILLMACNIKML